MAEVSSELMYEVLKKMQGDLLLVKDGVRELKGELSAIRGHIGAIQTDIRSIYDQLAGHDIRLDRIERRLDLVSEHAR